MSCSVHDVVDLETRGVPGVVVASSVFGDAAVAQAAALGMEPAVVWVPHPVQDRTDAEMEAMADTAVEEILRTFRTS